MNVLCEVLMNTHVECVLPEDPVDRAARRLRRSNVGFLPVCDRLGKVLGTVTDRDIAMRVVAERRPLTTTVSEIMSREIVACGAQDEIGLARELMTSNDRSRIMCVDEAGRIEGIISLSDIAQRNGAPYRTQE